MVRFPLEVGHENVPSFGLRKYGELMVVFSVVDSAVKLREEFQYFLISCYRGVLGNIFQWRKMKLDRKESGFYHLKYSV